MRIRIGNDITIRWDIYRYNDGLASENTTGSIAEDLTNAINLTVQLGIYGKGIVSTLTEVIVDVNLLTVHVPKELTPQVGKYYVVLDYDKTNIELDDELQHYRLDSYAFDLVSYTASADGVTDIAIESQLVAGIDGINGLSSYELAVHYEGFTGTVEDYIASLRQPAIEAKEEVDVALVGYEELKNELEGGEEARIYNEQLRVAAETARSGAEATRVSNESNRVAAETARVDAEDVRATAEDNRTTAEASRVTAETARAGAETTRVSAESQRVANENTRGANEASRVTAETARVTSEDNRVSAESARGINEASRVDAETARAGAEATRALNETARVDAEEARVAAENNRANELASIRSDLNEKVGKLITYDSINVVSGQQIMSYNPLAEPSGKKIYVRVLRSGTVKSQGIGISLYKSSTQLINIQSSNESWIEITLPDRTTQIALYKSAAQVTTSGVITLQVGYGIEQKISELESNIDNTEIIIADLSYKVGKLTTYEPLTVVSGQQIMSYNPLAEPSGEKIYVRVLRSGTVKSQGIGISLYKSSTQITNVQSSNESWIEITLPDRTTQIALYKSAAQVTTSGIVTLQVAYGIEQKIAELESDINFLRSTYSINNNVLWVGTSIPESAHYPAESCLKNGYNCINKSLGSSSLTFRNEHPTTVSSSSGRQLTATVNELELLYRSDVENSIISEATLNGWKNGSYENSIMPYIDGSNPTQVSMIVIDHGYNDRSTIRDEILNIDSWNWESEDRSTFYGAFRYLLNKIQSTNPFIKIVVGGYFTNTVYRWRDSVAGVGNFINGEQICKVQQAIANKYNLTILKVWEHTQISNNYINGTSSYITDFNSTYGTNYSNLILVDNTMADMPNPSGNISAMQLYCPDGVHPHSDLTGNCNKRLNAIYSQLIQGLI